MNKEPIPTIEFHITEKCNYRCEYCVQGKGDVDYSYKHGHADDKVIDSFVEFIKGLDETYHINLIGGEPIIHPRFKFLLKEITNLKHKVSFCTNFSYSIDYFKEIADTCGENLEAVSASLHLTQVKSLDDFIQKAIEFNKYKNDATAFNVLSVVTEENFETIKKVHIELDNNGVLFNAQNLKVNGKYVTYSQEIEEYMIPMRAKVAIDVIKDKYTRGVICPPGYKFFNIYWDGTVVRCYSKQDGYPHLGSISKGTFKPFDKPMPCFSDNCVCVFPALRNMINLEELKAQNPKR